MEAKTTSAERKRSMSKTKEEHLKCWGDKGTSLDSLFSSVKPRLSRIEQEKLDSLAKRASTD